MQCDGSAQLPGPLDSGLLAPPDTGLLLLKKDASAEGEAVEGAHAHVHHDAGVNLVNL